MERAARISIWIVTGLVALLALLVLIIALFNWNWLKPFVEDKASDALQRPVVIEGDLDVEWDWREGWLPWPRITAEQVTAGHPEGFEGTDENMARIEFLAVTINPMPLFTRHVEIERVEIGESRLVLERNLEDKNNWGYERAEDSEESESGWTVDLQSVALRQVEVQVTDQMRKLDMTTRFNSLDTDSPEGYGMDWESSGTFNDAEVGGSGKVGGLLSLRESGNPFPMQGEISFGETRMAIEGSMTAPQGAASLDVGLKLAGSSLSDLNALFGLALPTTPPYQTEGRLIGKLNQDDKVWRYENFSGQVGESDLRGTVEYTMREPRPLLTGNLESNLLRFADLGPLIGIESAEGTDDPARSGSPETEADEADSDSTDANAEADETRGESTDANAEADESGGAMDEDRAKPNAANTESDETRDEPEEAPREQPPGKALPVARIGSETWDFMDADVRFVGKRIVRDEDLPLDNIEAHVSLQDRVLSFKPLNFGIAGGTLSNTIHVDGRGDLLQAEVTIAARSLELKQLLPGADAMEAATFGQLYGDAHLKGTGDSVASVLGSSNGELSLALSPSTISRFLMEAAGLNVLNVIFVKLFGDEQVNVECLIADFAVNDGLVQTRAFVLETEDAVITMEGQVSLKNETLDLDIRPQNKELRILTLRSPLYAKGTFKDPDVGVQAGPIAARAGAAVALGVIATPLAAIIPLLNVGTEDAGCSTLQDGGAQKSGGEESEDGEEAEDGDTGIEAGSRPKPANLDQVDPFDQFYTE